MTRKKISFHLIGMALLAAVIITHTACSSNHPDAVSRDGFFFDTVCNITIYDMKGMSSENAADVISDAFDECERYEGLFSKTLTGTDVYRINHAGGVPVECSLETIDLIEKGLYYSALSEGRFDMTIGKAADLWDFHGEGSPVLPDADALSDAVSHIGYEDIRIAGTSVTLQDPKAEIDLGGIAKGYIADQLCLLLRERGVTSALISLGGNISSIGDKYGTPFRVGIREPFADASSIHAVTPCSDGTVVSSGIYERCFRIDDTLYHHILDPQSGMPAETDIDGVTVIADNTHSSDCDALATICILYGREKALELIEGLEGFEACIIDDQDETFRTSGFPLE